MGPFVVAAGLVAAGIFAPLALAYHAWMPLGLGIGLAGAVALLPDYRDDTRPVALALVLSSLATVLWIHSSDLRLGPTKVLLLHAFEQGYLLALVLGAVLFGWASNGRRWNWPLVVLVFLLGLVAYFSGPRGAGEPMIQWVVRTLGLSHGRAETFVFFLRKCIHFGFYSTAAFTALRVARVAQSPSNLAVLFGMAIALLFACFDEGRQASVPTRSGSVADVALDLFAAGCVLAATGWARHGRPSAPARRIDSRSAL